MEKVGSFHYYQYRSMILFGLQWLMASMLSNSSAVFFMTPSFWCDGVECSETTGGCASQIVNEASYDSITKEFSLYCSQTSLKSVAESSIFIGALIGNLLFSFVSIKRRSQIGIAWGLGSIGCAALGFSPDIYWFIFFFAVTGFGCFSAIIAPFAIMSEQGSSYFCLFELLRFFE